MKDTETFHIRVPCDDNGFVLLRCEICGEYFKVFSSVYEDEGVLNLYCPSCGLISKNYSTPEVMNLVEAMTYNYASDEIYNMLKKFERETKHDAVQIKVGNRPDHIDERPIMVGIEALKTSYFQCCKKTAKIRPLLKFCGCYCPFCGVKDYEVK